MGKIWEWIKISLLIAGLAMIIFPDLSSKSKRLRVLPTQAELDAVLPGSSIKDKPAKPIPYYPGTVQEGGKTRRAAALLTAELPPKVKGYTDEINILFAIDEDGKVIGLKVISQRETPYYFRMVRAAGFFEKVKGSNAGQIAEIKAVSGASVSSKAILDDVQGASVLAMREIFKREVPAVKSASLAGIYLAPRMLALMMVLVLGLAARFLKWRPLRWAVLALSVMVIGFWLKTPFALPHLFQIAALQVPFQSNPYLVLLGGFVILTTIIFGPLWCACLCPYAGLQELASELGKRQRWRPSPRLVKVARELRWVVLGVCVVLYFPLGMRSGAEIEPFFHLFSKGWTAAGLLLVAVTLAGSIFIPRFWCRFFCPTGAVLILLSSHRKIFRRIEQGIRASKIDSSEASSSETQSTLIR